MTHNGLLVVQKLLYWMYTSDYSDRRNFCLVKTKKAGAKNPVESSSSHQQNIVATGPAKLSHESRRRILDPQCLVFNIDMFLTTIRYQIPDLENLAKEKYLVAMPYCWNSEEFVGSVGFLWGNTRGMEEDLKEEVAKVVFEHLGCLEGYDEFRTILWGEGAHRAAEKGFARDLLVAGRKLARMKAEEMGKEIEDGNGKVRQR